tara:strand:+ start:150 stop:308 length:159 start_codon:yes stop_codon:yes gene_type:complete
MYQIVSKSDLSIIKGWGTVHFEGTIEECERTLPRIKYVFKFTSDEFKIIKKS